MPWTAPSEEIRRNNHPDTYRTGSSSSSYQLEWFLLLLTLEKMRIKGHQIKYSEEF